MNYASNLVSQCADGESHQEQSMSVPVPKQVSKSMIENRQLQSLITQQNSSSLKMSFAKGGKMRKSLHLTTRMQRIASGETVHWLITSDYLCSHLSEILIYELFFLLV